MSREILLLVVVVVTYAILLLRKRSRPADSAAAAEKERKREERKVRLMAALDAPAAKRKNPYTASPDLIDLALPAIEKVADVLGVNSEDPALPPDRTLEAVRNLWPKPGHHPGKRTGLSDVSKPADPGDGPLEPESEP